MTHRRAIAGQGFNPMIGLQHYWHPSRYQANPYLDYAGDRNGTATNMLAASAEGWYFGDGGSTLRYVTLSGPIANGSAYTISIWMRPNTTAMASHAVGGWAFNDRENTALTRDWQLYWSKSERKLVSQMWVGSTAYIDNDAVSNDAWVHVVMCVGSNVLRRFHNATPGTPVPYTGSANDASTTAARFGQSSWLISDTSTQWRGYIDHCRIYSYAPSTASGALAMAQGLYALGRV